MGSLRKGTQENAVPSYILTCISHSPGKKVAMRRHDPSSLSGWHLGCVQPTHRKQLQEIQVSPLPQLATAMVKYCVKMDQSQNQDSTHVRGGKRSATKTRENVTESAMKIGRLLESVLMETLPLTTAVKSVTYLSCPVQMDPTRGAQEYTKAAHGSPKDARPHPACLESSAKTNSHRTAPGRQRIGTITTVSATTTLERIGQEKEDTAGEPPLQGTAQIKDKKITIAKNFSR